MCTRLFSGQTPLCKLAWTLLDCVRPLACVCHVCAHTHTSRPAQHQSLQKQPAPLRVIRGRFCISFWKRKTVSMSRGRDGMLMKPQKRLFLRTRFPLTLFRISGSPQCCAWGVYAGEKTRQINWCHWKANEKQQWVMTESGGLVSLSQRNTSNNVIDWNENNQMRSCYRAGARKGGAQCVLSSYWTQAALLCSARCCLTLPNFLCWRYSYCTVNTQQMFKQNCEYHDEFNLAIQAKS